MRDASAGLGTQEGYSGYGAEQGRPELRKAVCDRFYASCGLKPEEIFISDGSKCDIGRLQMMFGKEVSVALQDPAYPVCVSLFRLFPFFSSFFSSSDVVDLVSRGRERERGSERGYFASCFVRFSMWGRFSPFFFAPLPAHLRNRGFSSLNFSIFRSQSQNKNSYVDSSVIMGMTEDPKKDGTGFEGIEYMLCRPETEFFPDLSKVRSSLRFSGIFLSFSRDVGKEKPVSFSSIPSSPFSFFPRFSFSTPCIMPRRGSALSRTKAK